MSLPEDLAACMNEISRLQQLDWDTDNIWTHVQSMASYRVLSTEQKKTITEALA